MTARILSLLFLFFLSVGISSGQSKKRERKPKEIILFTLGDQSLYADEFLYLFNKNHPSNSFSLKEVEEYLDLFIQFKLKVAEAKLRKLDSTETFKREFQQYQEALRRPYLPEEIMLDSLVKLTYNRLTEEVQAAHILISLNANPTPSDTLSAFKKIIEIRNRILNGEDFETLARQFSGDPSVQSNGGNLGYFTALQMVFPFENAAFTTPVGEVSPPVKTRYGYHLIKVLDRRPSSGEVEVAHIMLRKGSGRTDLEIQDLIFDVFDQLKGGRAWEEVCLEFSEDTNSKNQGGKLKPFSRGAFSAVPEFETMAFSLQDRGEISDPFETVYGWHILRLEKKIKLLPFETMAPALKEKIRRDDRIISSKGSLFVRLKEKYGFLEYPKNKAAFWELVDSTLLLGKWNPVLPKKLEMAPLFELDHKPYLTKSFFDHVHKVQHANSLEPKKQLDQFFDQFVQVSMDQMISENLLKNNPEYRHLFREYYEGLLLFDIMEREVWKKSADDTVALADYFKRHQEKYTTPESARLTLYESSNPSILKSLKDALQSGDTLQTKELLRKGGIKEKNGLFERKSDPLFAEIDWNTGVHWIETSGKYYLATIFEILSPQPLTFEKARMDVITDFQTDLEKKWVESLKKKYPVTLNEKGKKHILKILLP